MFYENSIKLLFQMILELNYEYLPIIKNADDNISETNSIDDF